MISKDIAMYSSTPYFNETFFEKVNINMNMDTGLNKECPWGWDSFHNAILSFWKYMPLPESGLSQFIHAIIKILGNHLLFYVCDRT